MDVQTAGALRSMSTNGGTPKSKQRKALGAADVDIHRMAHLLLQKTTVFTEMERWFRNEDSYCRSMLFSRLARSLDFEDQWWDRRANLKISEWAAVYRHDREEDFSWKT